MVDYETDDALQEIHDEMYRREEERPKSAVSKLGQQAKLFIGIAVAAIAFLYLTDKVTLTQGGMGLLAGAAIIYFMQNTESKRDELTWLECMIRINDSLKFLQRHPVGDTPQVPLGKLSVLPIGRKQWFEGRSFKRSFAVDIGDREKGITEHYFLEVDIFTGDIITFRYSPEGVYGDETRDIILLPSFDMLISKKRDQYLNKSYRSETSRF